MEREERLMLMPLRAELVRLSVIRMDDVLVKVRESQSAGWVAGWIDAEGDSIKLTGGWGGK